MKRRFTIAKTIAIVAVCLMTNLANAQTRRADSTALVALYNATGGASCTTNTNWLSGPIDNWYGVTVTNGRVSAVSLSGNNLVGGPIPRGIVIDSALVSLDLSNNAITGAMPTYSDTSLTNLNLSGNQFTGTFNGYNYNLPNLQSLNLANNQLTGAIGSLSKFSKLITLNASNNQFNGTIPYFNDSLLTTLNLSTNQLTGTINYYATKSLQYVDLSNNLLTGSANAMASFANIVSINLSNNQFTGGVPYFGGKASLVTLNLSNNLFTALSYFSDTLLQTIDISNNVLTGTIGYYNTPSLVTLKLDHNQLTGSINIYKGKLKDLEVNSNLLTGPIVTNLAGLSTILLDSNKFTFNAIQPVALDSVASFTYAFQDTTLPLNFQTYGNNLLTVTAGGTLANNTYAWYQNGNLVATKIGDSTYQATSIGNYYVIVHNAKAPLLPLQSALYNVISLPIVLTSFTASLVNEAAASKIEWSTSSQINNSYFDVERSINGVEFSNVGTVPANNSKGTHNYTLTDNVAGLSGVVYYRLKQVDVDGKFTYSKIVSVNIAKATSSTVNVYPNPIKTTATLQINSLLERQVSIVLVNANGAVVFKLEAVSKVNFAAASYFMECYIFD